MKKAILIYSSINNITNIGDYIQSLAARQFLEEAKEYEYVNREQLHQYKGEPAFCILNGWFMHNPMNWPPSKDIIPYFISFHINSTVELTMLDGNNIQYFKQWEPIGCRDYYTTNLLKDKGIDAYYSSCLTLTLNNSFHCESKGDDVYFVDPYVSVHKSFYSYIEYIKIYFKKRKLVKKISKSLWRSVNISSLLKACAFISHYNKIFDSEIIENAVYMTHLVNANSFNSEDEKFQHAQDLLTRYSKAKLIITSRIHCALPSLSFNTPVLYVHNNESAKSSYCRLDGLLDFFNLIVYENGSFRSDHIDLSEKISTNNKIVNKNDYKRFQNLLNNNCSKLGNEYK